MIKQFNGTFNTQNDSQSTFKPDDTSNFGYYHEYCRLFLANVVLTSQMKQLMNQRAELTIRMSKIEKKTQQIENGGVIDDRKKRKRRTAGQIQRHYQCVVQTCGKSYGSEGSLNQHIKLKHPQIYEATPHLFNTQCKSQQIYEDEEQSSNSLLQSRKKRF